MTDSNIIGLWSGIIIALITVIIVIVLKKLSRISPGPVGPELNLLTYGFLWDIAVKALSGGEYWPNIYPGLCNFQNLTLATIVILNSGLLVWNFQLVSHLEKQPLDASASRVNWLKFKIYFLGVISLMIFLAIKTFWE